MNLAKLQNTKSIHRNHLHFYILTIKKVKSLSHVPLFATPWTIAHQAPPSMEFSRQEYWSGVPFPSPGDLPDPRIEPRSPALQADSFLTELPGNLYLGPNWMVKDWEAWCVHEVAESNTT